MNRIRIRRIKVLAGPNLWASFPVLQLEVDLGEYDAWPADKLPAFADRLIGALPGLREHPGATGVRGGFLQELRSGTDAAPVLEHVILELQALAGMEAGFGRVVKGADPASCDVIVQYQDAEAAEAAADLAVEILESLAAGESLAADLASRIEKIRALGEKNALGPSTRAIVDAAARRHIPWFRLDDRALIQLGHGRHARRVQATRTSLTSAIAANISADKEETKRMLAMMELPVPRGKVVRGAKKAARAARRLDGPVVVKPLDGNHGRGVGVGVSGKKQIKKAFKHAREFSRSVLVEEHIAGREFRLLVVGEAMVAAVERTPAAVAGDGARSVRELIEQVNAARSADGRHGAYNLIRIDRATKLALSRQGMDLDSVPAAGETVRVRDNANLSTGGSARDVTGEVHPENAAMAVLAARTIGLDVAGIDLVCQDIGIPLREQQAAILEVNAAPGLLLHLAPAEGKSRPVADAIVDMLFPAGAPARVPLIAVTGTNGKTTVTRMIAHIYSTMKKFVGMTTTDGVYCGGERAMQGDCSGPRSAELVLQHPLVEVAVLETARGGILRAGLAWDRSTVSVVLNVSGDHLGLEGIHTVEELARVKRVIVENVSPEGYAVLNADDALVTAMADYCPGGIIFFSMDPDTATVRAHLDAGGKAVYQRDGLVVLASGAEEIPLLRAEEIPATYGGLVRFQLQNALAAAAACWGAGVPPESIRLGLRTFQANDRTAPGRFNLFEVGGARVIVDYGHNHHALRAVREAIAAMRPRRAIGLIGTAGDRRDEDLREMAQVAADTFDVIVLRESTILRGRPPGDLPRVMAEAIAARHPERQVVILEDEREGVRHVLSMLRDGDLAVLAAHRFEEAIELVKQAALDAMPEH